MLAVAVKNFSYPITIRIVCTQRVNIETWVIVPQNATCIGIKSPNGIPAISCNDFIKAITIYVARGDELITETERGIVPDHLIFILSELQDNSTVNCHFVYLRIGETPNSQSLATK